MHHAVWLSEALAGVDTREDLLDADLGAETWVDLWVDGAGDEYCHAAAAIHALATASSPAVEILERGALDAVTGHTSAGVPRLREAMETLANADPHADVDFQGIATRLESERDHLESDAAEAYATDGDARAADLYALIDGMESLLDDLTHALDAVDGDLLDTVRHRVDALPVGGDLRALLDAAVAAVRGDAPEGTLDAARTALRGGREGCRELALFARDGYAHPDAWAHLAGAIAHPDDDGVREVNQQAFAFDLEAEGGRYKRLRKNGAVIIADKNHHGALVVDTPAFTDITGKKCPVLGLDATGRPELWRLAINRDVEVRDIHATDAERRRKRVRNARGSSHRALLGVRVRLRGARGRQPRHPLLGMPQGGRGTSP